MKKLELSHGATYGHDSAGNRVCTGSQMWRRNVLPPEDHRDGLKVRLERLKWVDVDYDAWGCYWGGGPSRQGNHIYCAHNQNTKANSPLLVFVRATTRNEAKSKVRESLPNARFYR